MSIKYAAISDEAESRYVYYLLAASAAALAYTLEKSPLRAFSFEYANFLLIVFSWAGSFYFGTRAAQTRINAFNLMANAETIETNTVAAKSIVSPAEYVQLHTKYINHVHDTNTALSLTSDRFSTYLKWQFRLLLLGSFAYLIWKLLPWPNEA